MSEALQHDIVIVGGGGAGLRAAIAVAELDPTLSVAVVSKVYPMRSHTVAAEGGAAAVIKDNDSLNGTFVNKRLISETALRDDDEITIGKYTLIYHEAST